MIPKIFHQIWISKTDKPLPDKCRPWVDSMRAMHPGWEYHLWGNELREIYAHDPFMRAAWERPSCLEAHMADRLRLLLLRDHGGVYCDVDAEPIRPFDALLAAVGDAELVAGLYPPEDRRAYCDVGTLMASRGSSVIHEILSALPDNETMVGGGGRIAGLILDRVDCRTRLLNWRYWFGCKPEAETLVVQVPHCLKSWVR